MESLILSLQGSDVKSRISALSQVLAKLEQSPVLAEIQNDAKFRLMGLCVSAVKDANPRAAQLGVDCVESFIRNLFPVFQPLTNVTFDLLIAKFGDIKQPTRSRATDAMVALINALGLSVGLDKILPQLGHRVWRVREQVLVCLGRLLEVHGADVTAAPELPKLVGTLLQDTQISTRQLAMELLCSLQRVFGDKMLADLETAGIRPQSLKQLQQAAENSRPNDHESVDELFMDPVLMAVPPPAGSTPRGTISTSKRLSAVRGGPPLLQRAMSDPNSDQPLKPPHHTSRPPSRGPSNHALSATAPLRSSVVSTEIAEDTHTEFSPMTNGACTRKFSPDYFLSILGDGPSLVRNAMIYTDRDLSELCATIQSGLQKPSDHWEDRMAALSKLQGLACMDAIDFPSFSTLLRGMHEQVSVQVTDLRSTVSKEGCRTIAILANRMGNSFSPFGELWFPTLMKLLTVKIQVISQAADRAARTVLYSIPAGAPRMVPLILESCNSKNPTLRKFGVEYCCIIVARWKQEYFDKHFSSMRQMLVTGIGDADPGVRKASRVLLWAIRQRGGNWATAMSSLLADLDASAQKHVKNEAQTSADDISDLFRKPDTYYPVESYYTCGSAVIPTSASHESEGVPSVPPVPRPDSRNSDRSGSSMRLKAAPPAPPAPTATAGGRTIGLPLRVTVATSAKNPTAGSNSRDEVSSSFRVQSDQIQNPPIGGQSSAQPLGSLAAAREIRENKSGSRRLSIATTSLAGANSGPLSGTSIGGPLSGSRRMSIAPNSGRSTSERENLAASSASSSLSNGPQRVARPGSATARPLSADQPGLRSSGSFNSVRGYSDGKSSDVMEEPHSNDEVIADHGFDEEADLPTDDGSIDMSLPGEELIEPPKRHSSLHELRQMTSDSLWDIRLRALIEIRHRLRQSFPSFYFKDGVFLGESAHELLTADCASFSAEPSTAVLSPEYIDSVLDMIVGKMGDPHSRVAMCALECIYLITFPMEVPTAVSDVPSQGGPASSNPVTVKPLLCPTSALNKLGYVLPALFTRLADRRSKIREKSNEILNNVKRSFDPNILVAALSPRLAEVSDRVRTAVIQFLLTIVPLCETFFRNPSNTHLFLSRMAHLLGSGGAMKPSSAFLQHGKRLLLLVYKTVPQLVLSQMAGLPLQEQLTIKKHLTDAVPNIDVATAAASRIEWSRITAAEGGRQPILNHVSSPKSISSDRGRTFGSRPEAALEEASVPEASPKLKSPPEPRSFIDNFAEEPMVDDILQPDEPDANDISHSSLYVADVLPAHGESPSQYERRASNNYESSPVSRSDIKSPGLTSRYSPHHSSDALKSTAPIASTPPCFDLADSKRSVKMTPSSASVTDPILSAMVTSPHLVVTHDIVWLLRTLGSPDFGSGTDERNDAISELKVLIKQGTDGFWTRNFAQIISVLLDAFTPISSSERSMSLSAANGLGSAVSFRITGLSPPTDSRTSRLSALDGDGQLDGKTGGPAFTLAQRENLSASDFNGCSQLRAESKSPSNSRLDRLDELKVVEGSALQALRMEYLHQVCRCLLLLVRHRSVNIENFLELMTCRLCEGSAFLPLSITMQCEQILGMACPLGAQEMAKALAPYCSYGSGTIGEGESASASENLKLPPPPDPSFSSSPSSSVRRLALRALALCIPHMTSRQLISILPLLMKHILPSFRSPLVDIRQAVVTAIVQMYVLIGDVLHPYVRELPPQQKKLLTIYIDRQLKISGSKSTMNLS